MCNVFGKIGNGKNRKKVITFPCNFKKIILYSYTTTEQLCEGTHLCVPFSIRLTIHNKSQDQNGGGKNEIEFCIKKKRT